MTEPTPRLSRRNLFHGAAGLSAVTLLSSCSGDEEKVPAGTIPAETAGPFPANGSNGPNILNQPNVVRSDIRTSINSASGSAEGVTLTLKLQVLNVSQGDGSGRAQAAVYAWQCDREGRYSMYREGIESENYLRGVQSADESGNLSFTTVFPGCYPGRWPHIHLEVYPSATAAESSQKLRTTQMAFPKKICESVYATSGYEESAKHLQDISLDSDGIFSDGHSLQMATMSGTPDSGLTATLKLPI